MILLWFDFKEENTIFIDHILFYKKIYALCNFLSKNSI